MGPGDHRVRVHGQDDHYVRPRARRRFGQPAEVHHRYPVCVSIGVRLLLQADASGWCDIEIRFRPDGEGVFEWTRLFVHSPADDFQLIGADIYNNVNDPTKSNYRTVPLAFDPLYSWVAANEPGMPLVIGELGEVQDDPNAPQWIGDAIASMKSHGNLLFVNWNVVDTSTNYYSPLLRSDTYQMWLAGAADPYFKG